MGTPSTAASQAEQQFQKPADGSGAFLSRDHARPPGMASSLPHQKVVGMMPVRVNRLPRSLEEFRGLQLVITAAAESAAASYLRELELEAGAVPWLGCPGPPSTSARCDSSDECDLNLGLPLSDLSKQCEFTSARTYAGIVEEGSVRD